MRYVTSKHCIFFFDTRMKTTIEAKCSYGIGRREYIWFLFGFSFVFEFPRLSVWSLALSPHHVMSLAVLFYTVVHFLLAGPRRIGRRSVGIFEVLVLSLALSFLWSIMGTVHSASIGASVPLDAYVGPVRIALLFAILLVWSNNVCERAWRRIERGVLDGFLSGALITSVYIILEVALYYGFHGFALTKLLFHDFLGEQVRHPFVNLAWHPDGGAAFRATGFAVDPGQTAPKLVATAMMLNTHWMHDRSEAAKVIALTLLVLGVVLTLSRTAIFGLLASVVCLAVCTVLIAFIRSLLIDRLVVAKWLAKATIRLLLVIITVASASAALAPAHTVSVLSFMSSAVRVETESVEKHLGYLMHLPDVWMGDVASLLIGYGTRNAGIGYERFALGDIPGIEGYMRWFEGSWVPESTLAMWGVMGGLPSFVGICLPLGLSLLHLLAHVLGGRPAADEAAVYMNLLLTLLFLTLGYQIASTWLYVVIFLVLRRVWHAGQSTVYGGGRW